MKLVYLICLTVELNVLVSRGFRYEKTHLFEISHLTELLQ